MTFEELLNNDCYESLSFYKCGLDINSSIIGTNDYFDFIINNVDIKTVREIARFLSEIKITYIMDSYTGRNDYYVVNGYEVTRYRTYMNAVHAMKLNPPSNEQIKHFKLYLAI